MKFTPAQLSELKQLLKDELGLMYTDQELEKVGLAIMRFVLQKELQKQSTNKKELKHEQHDEEKNQI